MGFGGKISDFLGCLDLPIKRVTAAAWYKLEPVYYRLYYKLKNNVFYQESPPTSQPEGSSLFL